MLNLVVIRSAAPEKLVLFYVALGLKFEKHAHGSGPEHFAAILGAVTFEIYPARDAADATTAVRLGFSVRDVEEAVGKLVKAGGRVVAPAKDSPWGPKGSRR